MVVTAVGGVALDRREFLDAGVHAIFACAEVEDYAGRDAAGNISVGVLDVVLPGWPEPDGRFRLALHPSLRLGTCEMGQP